MFSLPLSRKRTAKASLHTSTRSDEHLSCLTSHFRIVCVLNILLGLSFFLAEQMLNNVRKLDTKHWMLLYLLSMVKRTSSHKAQEIGQNI